MAKKKVEGLDTQELIFILSMALSQIMAWMPDEGRSKAILIPDPRDPTQLCAVHNGPDGITLLMGEGFKDFCKELLCDDCIASLHPYSVIYTGFNLETGEFDPDTYIGLHGSHDEDVEAAQSHLRLVVDNDEVPEITSDDVSPKRTLN